MNFTSVKIMLLDFSGIINKIYDFFSVDISNKMLLTEHPFSLRFALSLLSIIFDMLVSCWSFFRDVLIMVFAILSAVLSEPKSLVATRRVDRFGGFLKDTLMQI